MDKRLPRIYLLATLTVALFSTQNLVAQSLSFDGDQDYVNVNTVASEMHVGEADWAVSFWVKPDLSSFPENDSYILGVNTSTGGNALHVGLKKNTGYPIVFEINSIHITGSTGATDQEWNHIVYSKLGYTGTIYLNGVSQGTHGAYHSLYNTHQWTIGGEYDSQILSNEFVGLVDEVAVWDDDLTAAEVAALYNSGAPLSASTNAGDYTSQGDLQAYWLMNEGSGSTIADTTTNNNSGTITGATWSTDTPGSTSSSYSTIASARSQGIGTSITVRGIVTTPNYTSSSGTALVIQDGTAGISIYSPSISNFLAVGDSVQVSGTRQEFNNKIQIWPGIAADITVISSNNPLPAFQVVTVANFVANGEDYESELIRINGVSITSGTWPTAGSSSSLMVSDDGGTSVVMLHIDSDTDIDGNSQPSSPFDLQYDAGQ